MAILLSRCHNPCAPEIPSPLPQQSRWSAGAAQRYLDGCEHNRGLAARTSFVACIAQSELPCLIFGPSTMPTVEIKCPICNGTHPLKVTPEQSTGAAPVVVVCPAIDRRYRLFGFSVDTRRSVFHGKHDNLTQNQIAQLQAELGLRDFDQKLARWRSVDFPPLGLIEEYSD